MKVYALPDHLPAPTFSDLGSDYDFDKLYDLEKEHSDQLKTWLLTIGYAGNMTGKIYSHPMGDGYAQYMVAHGIKDMYLIHLPYGDAWDHPDVAFLPSQEVIKRIAQTERARQLFASKGI